MRIRCISLYQPYASLIFAPSLSLPSLGAKSIETRGRDTKVRGLIGIHATANTPKWCKEIMETSPLKSRLKSVEPPTGVILGMVELTGTMPTEQFLKEADSIYGRHSGSKLAFFYGEQLLLGDFSPGRFAWKMSYPTLFSEPIPAKGKQGFWFFDLPPTTYPV